MSSDIIILDVETTISNNGNAFDTTNKCVCIGIKQRDGPSWITYNIPEDKSKIQEVINKSKLIVGFNIKFDLHWLRTVGIDISNIVIWDCQLAEFIFNFQKTSYPSLNDTAEKYRLPSKLDVVKLEYWDKGIDTDQIPREILSEYLNQDLLLTEQVFNIQQELFKSDGRYKLFRLQCQDLLVLADIEYNGINFNTEEARASAAEITNELSSIEAELIGLVGCSVFNPNSNDHVSAALYGGVIEEEQRLPVGVYATGAKIGQTRYKILRVEHTLERLVEPIKGTETAKSKKKRESGETQSETSWEVNDTVLRKLKLSKKAKAIVQLLGKQAGLSKLANTYLIGWSDLIDKMNWTHNTIHGTLNQCTVITGRLSSTKP